MQAPFGRKHRRTPSAPPVFISTSTRAPAVAPPAQDMQQESSPKPLETKLEPSKQDCAKQEASTNPSKQDSPKPEASTKPMETNGTVTCCLRGRGLDGMEMRGNVVHSLRPGSEPACAGVRKGDRVIKVDDTCISDGQWFCLEALVGEDNVEVTLTLLRSTPGRRRTSEPEVAEPAATGSVQLDDDDHLAFQMPKAPATTGHKIHGHMRRASAPPGFGSRADRTHKESASAVSPRTVVGEGKEEPESPATKLNQLRTWWATKKADKVPATVALPTMPFLDEAFEDDGGEDKSLLIN